MKIGIIGLGVVGKTILKAFKKLKNNCFGLDVHNLDEFENLLKVEIIYICLPTSHTKKGLNISIIRNYLSKLDQNNYKGTIVIKSTLNPGDISKFEKQFKKLGKRICHVPEFLRERCAYKDFTQNHDLLLIGSRDRMSIKRIIKNHGKFPKKIKIVNPAEAELIKIYSNAYNAARVVFANSFFEICKTLKVNYKNVLEAYLLRDLSTGNYLSCNETLRGFGGKCLPKDLYALDLIAKKKSKKVRFFENILKQNNVFKTTVMK
tara:strand:+ start:3208 stop:3993 length:786 start_codon:yes stop_codon:yes gene_type:complete